MQIVKISYKKYFKTGYFLTAKESKDFIRPKVIQKFAKRLKLKFLHFVNF